ncbi:MAG: type III-A CRISPR-associated RAMP protein Csm5 [Bacteroidetes bacterium]|nr:type III-A CRISPR-associated RAMP protein Csm5 [Bacteroidota bacterium]
MKLLVIETLSPVHIGSGRQLMGGIEYLYMSKEDSIAVLDDKKILNLLGKERLDKWIAIINQNGSVLELLNNVDPALNSSKIALRNVGCGINRPQQQNSIREHLLAGNMKPTIPGSSLKGCIRTAWFRKEVLKIAKIDKTKMGKTSFNSKIRKEDFKWNQKQLNEELIGKILTMMCSTFTIGRLYV